MALDGLFNRKLADPTESSGLFGAVTCRPSLNPIGPDARRLLPACGLPGLGKTRSDSPGVRQGSPYEAWLYLQQRSIYTGYYGPRFSRFGLYRYSDYWPGYPFYGPFADPFYDGFVTVDVPYRSAFFENGRCTGWEYIQY